MTITASHIPQEVVEAVAEVICNADDPDGHAWKTASELTLHIYRDLARAAIAAALAAWPHALIERGLMADPYKVPSLILPLPQEPGDD